MKRINMQRAFIYSLDAFIALIIIILSITVLSLSDVFGGSYYSIMYQAKILAVDTLKVLVSSGSLDDILSEYYQTGSSLRCNVEVGQFINSNYGFELSLDRGNGWEVICSRGDVKASRLVVQAAYVVSLIAENERGLERDDWRLVATNPYIYKTCEGEKVRCSLTPPSVDLGSVKIGVVRLRVFQ